MNNTSKNNTFKSILKFVLASALLFACTLLFMPELGVMRTIPFFLLGGALANFFGMTNLFSAAMSFVMTLCMYLASGKELAFSICYALVAAIICALGVYLVSLVKIAVKTEKNKLKHKCRALAVFSALLAVLVSAVTCGNPFSYISSKIENEKYIETYYDSSVKVKYTRYAPVAGEYRTFVKFTKDGVAYGVDENCFVSEKHDGIREVFAKDILDSASLLLSKLAASSDGGFYVVGSQLDFEENEVNLDTTNSIGYLSRVSYVMSFDGLLGKGDRDKFSELCEKTVDKIEQGGFVFDTIVLCGGDASEVRFSAVISSDKPYENIASAVKPFDEKDIKPFGVKKEDILAYWQNN